MTGTSTNVSAVVLAAGMGTRMNGGVQPSPSACTFKLPHIGSEASITTGSGIKLQRKRIIKRQK